VTPFGVFTRIEIVRQRDIYSTIRLELALSHHRDDASEPRLLRDDFLDRLAIVDFKPLAAGDFQAVRVEAKLV
jgi:hypothetical protein